MVVAMILSLAWGGASASSSEAEWRLIGLNAEQQHHSPLADITDKNVDKLGLAWSVELPTKDGLVGVPLVADDVIYESGSMGRVYANDVRTGRLLWSFDAHLKPPPGKFIPAWGGRVNRGLALWKEKVFIGTGDCRLIAIDRQHGTQVWETQACDPSQNYTITGAPRIGAGKVFIGNANADTGSNRGYVDAYEAETGRRLWRFFTIPGAPAKGFESDALAKAAKTWGKDYWKRAAGGSVWDAITYDPVLNLVYIGTDGASPTNPSARGEGAGDELFTTSIIALNADTGAYVWHYQTTPHDGWNYDATMHIMIAELAIEGKKRRVVMEAPKNGFFYVLDAATGKLLAAKNFVPVTWASKIDMKTGRPVLRPGAEWWLQKSGSPKLVTPTVLGAHNWQPMSFSPQTGLVYIPTMEQPMTITPGTGDAAVGGVEIGFYVGINDPKQFKGGLVAWDPITETLKWRHDVGLPQNGGVLSTAGNLVFQGTSDGLFRAYRADNGKVSWSFRADGGIYAAPITVKIDGTQLVIVPSGSGTSSSVITYPRMGGATHGPSRLLAFKLGGSASLSASNYVPTAIPKPALLRFEEALAARGREMFYSNACDLCHGYEAIGPEGAGVPDLRKSSAVTSGELAGIILGGLRSPKGMPSFAESIKADQLPALQAFLVNQAWIGYDAEHAAR
jgi:PQQ-dependent dehydrogenase (methanol/ethanol family)